jgi:UDP-glucose 4-epimerase
MKCLVTGCAGFIGSNLVDRLLLNKHEIVGIDNFSTGNKKFLTKALSSNKFNLIEGDLLDSELLKTIMKDVDAVFHFAANADVRFGTDNPSRDLKQNTIATFNVLEAMRLNNVKKILFSSTGSVYGESDQIPTKEDGPFPIQTSLYGASKLAGEGLITAYCEGFEFQSWIFRFVSILGDRYSHGHVFDFYRNLKNDPNTLKVLGNGLQKKSYLHVEDCIDAVLLAFKESNDKVNLFNLGVNDYCEVNDSIGWICSELNLSPQINYSGGDRGWIGDNPFIYLDNKKITALGWKPKHTIKEGVISTVKFIQNNEWILNER